MTDPTAPRTDQQKADEQQHAAAGVNVARSGDGKTVFTWGPRNNNEEDNR